ncbi:hypothetical protein BpHYR1_021127 [Brachionus plicatilis]|uniref:Uncharacterized protein n=1 Tax=Brachionus plicatilis TaxID=10195 RepID=A0A3M7QYD1_BRAPC|nr:hypothetical protein BpHYR1_021127 [Brachionus plicatilis]
MILITFLKFIHFDVFNILINIKLILKSTENYCYVNTVYCLCLGDGLELELNDFAGTQPGGH